MSKTFADGQLVVGFIKGTTEDKAKDIVKDCGGELKGWINSLGYGVYFFDEVNYDDVYGKLMALTPDPIRSVSRNGCMRTC